MTYIPLHVHSHYSLQLGLSKPSDIAQRCLELGINSCAITDAGTISGTIAFYKEMLNNNIKPILGCELLICNEDASIKNEHNQQLSKLIILCKNINGWYNLIKIVSKMNSNDFFYKKPRIDLDNLKKIVGQNDLICITGFYESTLWNNIISDNELNADWESQSENHIQDLNNIFGSDNVFIEIQLFDNTYNQSTISQQIRNKCKDKSWKRICGIDSYYCYQDDSVDQRILLCSSLKTTLPEISKKIITGINTSINHFFNSIII